MGLIIPKTYVAEIAGPLVFLAGPIREAPNWQDYAATFLLSKEPDLTVASPRRGKRNPIFRYLLEGDENHFSRQREWERHYLDLASKRGAILFWLPGETLHECSKAYGAMTRLELGQVMTASRIVDFVNFCVGSDGEFSELNTIKYDLSLDAPDKFVFNTLEETCREALRLAVGK